MRGLFHKSLGISILCSSGKRRHFSTSVCSRSCELVESFDESKRIRYLTLNRPTKLNALNVNLYESLTKALEADNFPQNSYFITVLSGNGPFYSSGNDLANFASLVRPDANPEEIREMAEESHRILLRFVAAFIDHPGILVAVLNGPAVGIAATTLALCDMVLAVDGAYIQTPFTKLGQNPESCSSYLFPKIMGPKLACDVLMLDRKLTPAEAQTAGLISHVFPQPMFKSSVDRMLAQMAQMPRETMLATKRLCRQFERDQLYQVNKAECDLLLQLWQSPECRLAIRKFFGRKGS